MVKTGSGEERERDPGLVLFRFVCEQEKNTKHDKGKKDLMGWRRRKKVATGFVRWVLLTVQRSIDDHHHFGTGMR